MPTGYTFNVADGEIRDFSAFAMQCARAFGACITMRDDSQAAPIPETFVPSPFYSERLAEAQARLANLRAMKPEQAQNAATEAWTTEKEAAERYNANIVIEDARLDAMLEKVEAWTPPTPEHEGMKTFMRDQLQISKHGTYRSPIPPRMTGPEWLELEIARVGRDIARYGEEWRKEVERADGRTQWVRALRASLQAAP